MILSIIILTWNSAKYIKRCIESIYKNITDIGFEVIVVDNGSKDGTAEILSGYSKIYNNLEVIYFNKNLGTTITRNLAVKKSKGEFILFLDSDTVIKSDSINILLEVIKRDENIGIAAPRLFYPDNSIQPSCKKFPTLTIKILKFLNLDNIARPMELFEKEVYKNEFSKIIEVDYCISACLLVRRSALESIGLFDERIFYAPEDVDLAIRMWEKGFKTLYVPKAVVIHHAQRISKRSIKMTFIHTVGLIYFFLKHRYLFRREKIYKRIGKI